MSHLRQSKKNILGIEEAGKLLRPDADELVLAARDGRDHYSKIDPALLVPFRKRTKANMLNDCIVAAASSRLDGHEGVKIIEDFESTFFIFDGRLALRYKKIDRRDGTSNVRTERQNDVDFHQLEFADFNAVTIVTLGYALNTLWTDISELKIICKYGDDVLWTIPLLSGPEATLSLFEHVHSQDFTPLVRSSRSKQGSAKRTGGQ